MVSPESLRAGFEQMTCIAASYGLDSSVLTNALVEMRKFVVTVPMVGAFNTGKSSLINAVLEEKLLPAGIVAQTTVPTEIMWGSEKMFVLIGEQGQQKVSVRNFTRVPTDLSQVRTMQLIHDHDFLQEIGNVRLVDTPGIDLRYATDEQLLKKYLADSIAYILVFSADEPVIKESVAVFLSQLRLREIPVYAVITKSDKVTSANLQQAIRFLSKQLPKLLGLRQIPLVAVSAKTGTQPAPFLDILRELQEQASGLCVLKYKSVLHRFCGELSAYLNLRMDSKSHASYELEGRLRVLEKTLEEFSRLQRVQEQAYEDQLEEAYDALGSRMRMGLEVMSEPVSVLVKEHRDSVSYIDQVMGGLLAGAVQSRFLPILVQYRKNLMALLDLQVMGEGLGSDSLRGSSTTDLSVFREQVLRIVLGCYGGCREAVEQLEGTCRRLPKNSASEEGVKRMVQNILLPSLLELGENCLRQGMAQCGDLLTEQAVQMVTQDLAMRRLALEDIRREKEAKDAESMHSQEQLAADFAAVESLMTALEE